jgi:hypothetical protein
MKITIMILFLIGMFTFFCGCSEDPMAPVVMQESQESIELAKKIRMDFSGESWSDVSSITMGKQKVLPNGVVLVRGFLISTDEFMDHPWVTGRIDWVVHWNAYPDGSDKRWGTGEMIVPDVGKWDLVYKGWKTTEGKVTYKVRGIGKGELIRGMKAYWTYVKPADQPFFTVTGFIIKHCR